MATIDEVKAALELALGQELRADIWALMVGERKHRTALKEEPGEHSFDAAIWGLADKYLKLARLNAHPENLKRKDVREIGADARLKALAEILALDAGRLPPVAEFRRRHLPEGLLEEASVGSWIRSRSGDYEQNTLFVTLAVPPCVAAPSDGASYADWLENLAEAIRARPSGPTPLARLHYEHLLFRAGDEFHPDMRGYADEIYDPEPHAQRVPVSPGTELWELRALSRGLALRNGWAEAAATNFVLTGLAPRQLKGFASIRRRSPFAVLTRIVLEVDPRLTPADVRRLYGELRRKVRGGGDQEMSEKHIQLALFIARDGTRLPRSVGLELESDLHEDRDRRSSLRFGMLALDSSGQGTPWMQLRAKWNSFCEDEHREWVYLDGPGARKFSRDVRNAWKRVTGQSWWSPLEATEAAE